MPQASPKLSPQDTKSRILDAAEELFVSGGFDSLSMRQITSAAGVNLAAVNYHFGSKDALIQAVLARKLDPLNEQRISMLDAFEQQFGAQLTCEHVLAAMFLPAVRLFRDDNGPHSGSFLQFLGRAYTEPSPVVRDFIHTHYIQTLGRFFSAFQRTLPDLTRHDLGFRLNFAMGALSGILAGGNTQRLIKDFTQGQGDEVLLLSRLSALMVAALRAPLPEAGQSTLFGDIALATQALDKAVPAEPVS
ncbi:MAG TPA: TetR family transcriptional regulator [Candidatus Aquabacterium excrementipullorum]|nr:TetR family transcriptional regulator [Candidatus Aquabacterium excrementipullorum]